MTAGRAVGTLSASQLVGSRTLAAVHRSCPLGSVEGILQETAQPYLLPFDEDDDNEEKFKRVSRWLKSRLHKPGTGQLLKWSVLEKKFHNEPNKFSQFGPRY